MFPNIFHISEVLPAIQGREEFIHGVREGFRFIDYAVTMPDTFQDPWEDGIDAKEQHLRLLRRECRGIKFDDDGNIAARPYHKFFNVNEKPETQSNVLSWSEPFDIFDKLDGSMVHPLFIRGELFFCTRMGITDVAIPALEYAVKMDLNSDTMYEAFCRLCESKGWTPMFEWCTADRYRQIVIKHPEDKLVLTGIRHKVSGYYLETFQAIAETFGIPTVGEWAGSWEGIEAFQAHTKALVDAEGYVIRWRDGHMVKTKGDWYVAIHRAKDAIQFEKDVIQLIIDGKLDDILPSLLDTDRDRLTRFELAFWAGVQENNRTVALVVDALVRDCPAGEPKQQERWVAEQVKNTFQGPNRSLAFAYVNGRSMRDHVIHVLSRNLGSGTRVERVRCLFGGINWLDY